MSLASPNSSADGVRPARALAVMCALLMAISIFFVVRATASIGVRYTLDYNEGWNAYHAQAAMDGGALYPAPPSFMYNNYPPISYYVIGTVGKALGDNITAGRLVSVLSFLLVGWSMVAAARRMGCRLTEALWGAAIFSTVLAMDYDYLGMNDPQLLGHAFATAGLVAFLRPARSTGSLALAAFLYSLGFFTKHDLILLPLASFLWLAVYDRRRALAFSGLGAGFLVAGLVLFQWHFGHSLWSEIDSPRTYVFRDSIRRLMGWLELGGIPLLASLVLLKWLSSDRHFRFCLLYLLLALGFGTWFNGGAGVAGNVYFDALIALGLTAAVGVNRLAALDGKKALVYAGCQFLPVILGLIYLVSTDSIYPKYWLDPKAPARVDTARDIALIREQPGPVLCSLLSLCYWAGKPPEVDVGTMGQALLTHRRKPEELIALFDRGYFDMIQLSHSPRDAFYSAPVGAAILQHYRFDHADENGAFYVRR